MDEYLQHKAHFFLSPLIFSFERKNLENLWLINDHFLTVFGHFFANFKSIFHKTEVKTVILRCLVILNFNWIRSNYIILIKEKKNPCLKMHHFRAISPRWILTPQKEISCHIFKMVILTKFFDNLMNYITREYAVKKMKIFLKFLPLIIVNLLLWPFKVSSLYIILTIEKVG